MAIKINKEFLPNLDNLNYVHTKYLGQNPDINLLHYESGIYGLYDCSQAPTLGIGVLEVLVYTGDWCVQRFTVVETGYMWQRVFTYGTTWGGWVQKW